MSQLRVALIVLGAVFVAVLALWERRRSSRIARTATLPEAAAPSHAASANSTRLRRVEPSIEDFTAPDDLPTSGELQVPTIHPVEPLIVDVAQEAAVDIPAAARAAAPAPTSVTAPVHASAPVQASAPAQTSA